MGNELTNYDDQLAKSAQAYVDEQPARGGNFLSIRAGKLSLGDEEFPGNQAAVVILDRVFENLFYSTRFNPDIIAPPICYAFGRGKDHLREMAPYPGMQIDPYFVPQSNNCAACPQNVMGTSETGRGKACKNSERIAVIPAGYYGTAKNSRELELHLFDDPVHFEQCDMAFLKVPVTSTRYIDEYIRQLGRDSLPPYAMITRLWVEPDPKYQVQVRFEPIERAPQALIPALIRRNAEAVESIIRPYQAPQEQQSASSPGGLRGLRRGR